MHYHRWVEVRLTASIWWTVEWRKNFVWKIKGKILFFSLFNLFIIDFLGFFNDFFVIFLQEVYVFFVFFFQMLNLLLQIDKFLMLFFLLMVIVLVLGKLWLRFHKLPRDLMLICLMIMSSMNYSFFNYVLLDFF